MNNRQNGRRRGRGGPQLRGPGGNPERGNRIDNRARGNAAQLLEKYKNLARDAQMQGDRVLTEYYNQFADHYFRVLSESRSRFEEQQQRSPRQDQSDDVFADDAEYQDEGERYEIPRQQQSRPRDEARFDRQRPQQERPQVQAQQDRHEPAPVEADRQLAGDDLSADDRRPRRRRARRPEAEGDGEPAPRIDMDRLAPAFADREPADAPREIEPAAEGEVPKRRRTRRPKDDDSVAA